MDQSAPYPEMHYETLKPAEYLASPIFSPDTVARLAHQERGSIATALHTQIIEAQRHPFEWSDLDDETFSRERFGSDTEVYRDVWKHIMDSLKESDAVKHYRLVKGDVESKFEVLAVIKAFERAVYRAVEAVPMTEKQRNSFLANFSERDYGLAGMMVQVADQYAKAKEAGIEFNADGEAQNSDFEIKHSAQASFLIAAPKLRNIDHADSKEIRGLVRRFGELQVSETAKSQMNRDLRGLGDITQKAA